VTSYIASFNNKRGAVNGGRKVFDKIVETGKSWNAFQMMREFPSRKWKKTTLKYCLIRKIDKTGSADRASCSGRPRSARTHDNIQTVEELVCSQERAKVPDKIIARETGMSHSSVRRKI